MYLSRLNNNRLEHRPPHPGRGDSRLPSAAAAASPDFADLVRRHIGSQSEPAQAAASNALLNRRTPFDARVLPAAQEQPQAGIGLVTESGAPKIVPGGAHPGYSGPAGTNPYFATPASPLCKGNVAGFPNWFQSIGIGGLGAFTWPQAFSATAEAAQEALRLVQHYVPEAKIEAFVYNSQIGSTPSHAVVLPNGEWMNAGLLLDAYYHQGYGVDSNSDAMLKAEIEWLTS